MVYAPTLTSDDETKASFYNQLNQTIQAVAAHDKLAVMGDFNARVGKDYRLSDGILGMILGTVIPMASFFWDSVPNTSSLSPTLYLDYLQNKRPHGNTTYPSTGT